MSDPGFVFPISLLDAFDETGQLSDPNVLQERDVLVEDALSIRPPLIIANPTFTAASGGATITFPRAFDKVPIVVVCVGDDVGTAPVTYRQVLSAATTSSFKLKVFSGATEQTSGTYRVAYIAGLPT